jgi:hypothetical protein
MSEKAEIIYFDRPFLIRVPAEGGGFRYAVAQNRSSARDAARAMGATDLEEMKWDQFFTTLRSVPSLRPPRESGRTYHREPRKS